MSTSTVASPCPSRAFGKVGRVHALWVEHLLALWDVRHPVAMGLAGMPSESRAFTRDALWVQGVARDALWVQGVRNGMCSRWLSG